MLKQLIVLTPNLIFLPTKLYYIFTPITIRLLDVTIVVLVFFLNKQLNKILLSNTLSK